MGSAVVRFTADLPGGGRIAYGIDPTLGGFWAEVRRPGGKLVEYDALHPIFNWKYPLDGLLHFLVEADAFTEPQLHDALLIFEQPHGPLTSEGARLAHEVIVNLKRAASN